MSIASLGGSIGRLGLEVLSLLLVGSAAIAAPQMVLVNAKIFTADPALPYAQAVAIEDGRIHAVGSNEQVRAQAGPNTRIIDAGGRLVTPGLTEAHVHLGEAFPTPPVLMPGLPFPGPSAEQLLAVIEQAAKTRTDWVSAVIGPQIARDHRNWRKALDAVAPNTPVLLRAFWGHVNITNSEGLRRLGITDDVADPLGGWWGRDESGHLDGGGYEAETIMPRIQPANPERLATLFGEAQQRYARWGVTSIHLMNNDKSLETTLAGLAIAKPLQKWTVYSWGSFGSQRVPDAWAAIDKGAKQTVPKVRIEGPKWLVDGTPIEQNSVQRADYVGRPGWRGRSNFTDAQLREILQLALAKPTQLALHVVGDGETDRVLKMMAELAPAETWREKARSHRTWRRHRPRCVREGGAARGGRDPKSHSPCPSADRGTENPRSSQRLERLRHGRHSAGAWFRWWREGTESFSQFDAGRAGAERPLRSPDARTGVDGLYVRRRVCGGPGKAKGPAGSRLCRRSCRAFAGCPDGADGANPGDDEPADDGRWRSDL